MLIMSQDKSRLVNVDDIRVEKNIVYGIKMNECKVVLGRYESSDRSYKVLQCISKSIVNNFQKDVIEGTTRTTGRLVFVMPQK